MWLECYRESRGNTAVITILTVLKSMAKGSDCDIEFEYVHRKYLQLDEDIITMIEDILEHPPRR